MNEPAVFGRPVARPEPGGALISVHVVPVVDGQAVAFDVEAKEARGRWFPWALLPVGREPQEAASAVVDDWCDTAMLDLRLIDARSLEREGGIWELALVYRAELAAMPAGSAERRAVALGHAEAIGPFAASDVSLWLGTMPAPAEQPAAPQRPRVF